MVFVFQELCPENFIHFKDKVVIKKLDARKYEESLKVELTNWIKNGNEEKVIFMFLPKLSLESIVFLNCII
jgi:hypothetical protein